MLILGRVATMALEPWSERVGSFDRLREEPSSSARRLHKCGHLARRPDMEVARAEVQVLRVAISSEVAFPERGTALEYCALGELRDGGDAGQHVAERVVAQNRLMRKTRATHHLGNPDGKTSPAQRGHEVTTAR